MNIVFLSKTPNDETRRLLTISQFLMAARKALDVMGRRLEQLFIIPPLADICCCCWNVENTILAFSLLETAKSNTLNRQKTKEW